jgi:hypothetical protein
LDIEKSYDNNASLNIERKSKGSGFDNAIVNVRNIEFDAIQKDSTLMLYPFFEIPSRDKLRAQEVKLKLYLPLGTKGHFDNSLKWILKYAKNKNDYWANELLSKTWTMTENGLEEVDK